MMPISSTLCMFVVTHARVATASPTAASDVDPTTSPPEYVPVFTEAPDAIEQPTPGANANGNSSPDASDGANGNGADDAYVDIAVYGGLAGGVLLVGLVVAVVVLNKRAARAPIAQAAAPTSFNAAYAPVGPTGKGNGNGHGSKPQRAGSTSRTLSVLPLPGLVTDIFGKQTDFPQVLLSYSSNSVSEGLGKSYMWALSNVLSDHGITSFNGYVRIACLARALLFIPAPPSLHLAFVSGAC